MTRIDQIRSKLEASLNADGKPRRGYVLRVAALRRELSRLELGDTAPAVDSQDSAGVDTPADPVIGSQFDPLQ